MLHFALFNRNAPTDKEIRIRYEDHEGEKLLALHYCSINPNKWTLSIVGVQTGIVYSSTQGEAGWRSLKSDLRIDDDLGRTEDDNIIQFFIKEFFYESGKTNIASLNSFYKNINPHADSHAYEVGMRWINKERGNTRIIQKIRITCILIALTAIIVWGIGLIPPLILLGMTLGILLSFIVFALTVLTGDGPQHGATAAEWANIERINDMVQQSQMHNGRISIGPTIENAMPLDNDVITDNDTQHELLPIDEPILTDVSVITNDDNTQDVVTIASWIFNP